jgi:hypothetical protein
MKNPHPDKDFFQKFEKKLNGQAGDLSLFGYACPCSGSCASWLEKFLAFF